MRHAEKVAKVTESRLVPGPKYASVEVDYVTAGGVKKTLVLAHCEADWIRASIVGCLDEMPEKPRKASFWASLRRKR